MKAIRYNKQKGGYMLVEIMVSLSIFALVAVSSTAALLSIIDANVKSQTTKSVMDNLNVAIENMSRSIRIGTEIQCAEDFNDSSYSSSKNCNGETGISFLPQDAANSSDRLYFFLCTADKVSAGTCNASGSIIKYRVNGGINTAITAPEVTISKLRFYVFGAVVGPGDGQPRVMMVMNGSSIGAGNIQSSFNIQTTVTQRQQDGS